MARLNKIYSDLVIIAHITGRFIKCRYIIFYVYFALIFMKMGHGIYHDINRRPFSIPFLSFPAICVIKFAIVCQFSALVFYVRYYMKYLCDNITSLNAELYVKLYERLQECSSNITETYKPMILLESLRSFFHYVVHVVLALRMYTKGGWVDYYALVTLILEMAHFLCIIVSSRLAVLKVRLVIVMEY